MLSFPKNSKLTIIGGAGRMGVFFANYFKAKGFSLTLSDVRKKKGREIAQKLEMDFVDDNKEAVKGADLVLVSVPIKDINEVILEVASHMKKGSVLAEISSIKGPLIDSLYRLKPMGLQPLSLHPLFGPTVKSLKGNSVVLVPVLEGDKIVRLRRHCPKCGDGYFLAEHKNRLSCGKCGYTEFKTKGKKIKEPKSEEKPEMESEQKIEEKQTEYVKET